MCAAGPAVRRVLAELRAADPDAVGMLELQLDGYTQCDLAPLLGFNNKFSTSKAPALLGYP